MNVDRRSGRGARIGWAVLVLLVLAGSSAAARRARPAPPPTLIRTVDVAVRDGFAYLAETNRLSILDVSNPAEPREAGRLGLPATLRAVAVDASGHAFLAAGGHGLYVADITLPGEPKLLVHFDPLGSVRDVRLAGSHAFLAAGREGLGIVDVSELERPLQIAAATTTEEVVALDVHAERRLVATAEVLAGARLFDVSRPRTPRVVAVLPGAAGALDVAFAGDLLLVAAGREGLLLYRVDAPLDRGQPIRLPLRGAAEAVCTIGPLAAVSLGRDGIAVIELAERPVVIAEIDVPGRPLAGRCSGTATELYVAFDRARIGVFDLTTPSAPRLVLPHPRHMEITFP